MRSTLTPALVVLLLVLAASLAASDGASAKALRCGVIDAHPSPQSRHQVNDVVYVEYGSISCKKARSVVSTYTRRRAGGGGCGDAFCLKRVSGLACNTSASQHTDVICRGGSNLVVARFNLPGSR